MNTYWILAYPAKHSLSPIIHNTWFGFLWIDAEYKIFEVRPENLDDFMKKIKENWISGLSVSMPFKQEVIKYLDEIDEISKQLNSVNTIYLEDWKLLWTNTDTYWILIPLLNEIYWESIEILSLDKWSFTISLPWNEIKKHRIAILWAGWAASAACFAAKYISDDVSIFNRTLEKAKELANTFNINAFRLNEFSAKDFDIILQMTSIWMLKNWEVDGSLVENVKNKKLELNSDQIIFESIYNPIETDLVKNAKNTWSKVITWENMLLYQALKQFTIWTWRKAPLYQIRSALLSR